MQYGNLNLYISGEKKKFSLKRLKNREKILCRKRSTIAIQNKKRVFRLFNYKACFGTVSLLSL